MKSMTKILILIALAMSSFTACSDSSNKAGEAVSKSYIINTLENKDIPIDSNLLAQTQDTRVKITRDVESEMMNVYVIKGSVEVSEVLE